MSLDGANLDASQEQLGKALDKAHQGEDKELAGQIRDTGERFVRQLFGAMRLTGIHDLENKAYDKPIKELVVTLGQLIDLLGAVHLVSVEGQIYINDVRVRMDERMDRGLGMRAWPSESTVASTRAVALRAIRSWSTSSAATCSPLIRRR